MNMKKWDDMDYQEKKETAELFAAWLCQYTQEVINSVVLRKDEILANDTTMMMLTELKKRQELEKKNFADSIKNLFDDYDAFNGYDPHNNVLEHSSSYRDVLYDMYIRGRRDDEERKRNQGKD